MSVLCCGLFVFEHGFCEGKKGRYHLSAVFSRESSLLLSKDLYVDEELHKKRAGGGESFHTTT